MSKEAALRAMREANYAGRSTAKTATSKPAKPATPAVRPATTQATKKTQPVASASPDGELCGHRSMNGRSCTREQGHTAKSHRYS
jgi:hypothetical protein